MSQDRLLLIRDLCARLPYGVKLNIGMVDITLNNIECEGDYACVWHNGEIYDIEDVIPYLRPMSSMTREEINELDYIIDKITEDIYHINISMMDSVVEFCNKHYLDHRGLIKKGLALEAPEGMY